MIRWSLLFWLISSSSLVVAPSIQRFPLNQFTSNGFNISRDGQSILSVYQDDGAFLITRQLGAMQLTLDGASDPTLERPSLINAVSDDLSVYVGVGETSNSGDSDREVLRWTDELKWRTVTGTDSEFAAMSADGNTVVGDFYDDESEDSQTYAFYWNVDHGSIQIPVIPVETAYRYSSWATDLSADGTQVVGYSQANLPNDENGNRRTLIEPFLWRSEIGTTNLGRLHGTDSRSVATAISGDGDVVVGYSEGVSGAKAFVWTADDGMQGLEGIDAKTTRAFWVANRGTVIFGDCGNELVVWDERRRIRSLVDYLGGQGFETSGWEEMHLAGISDDGNKLLLEARIDGDHHAMALNFHQQRCDVLGDGLCSAADLDAISAEARGDKDNPFFDLTRDFSVDESDREFWVTETMGSFFGDSNLDGQFDLADLVQVFRMGDYEDGFSINSGWGAGDWNGDGEFDSQDLVFAMKKGGFEAGHQELIRVIPEPSFLGGWLPLGIAVLWRTVGKSG